MTEHPVILFDGVCNLCNGAVQFVIKHDSKGLFKFASLQGTAGILITENHGVREGLPDSFLLLSEDKIFSRSTAALLVAKKLDGPIFLLYGFIIVPAFIRDAVYNLIAKNRYRWFGRTDQCMIPSIELQSRFL